MTIRALIFDVDGTLSETEEAHRQAFNDAFAEFGLDWNWSVDLYRKLLRTTGGKERMAAYLQDYLGGTLDAVEITRVHARKTERYGELVSSGMVDLRPGIKSLIADSARSGCRLAVATTTNTPNVDHLCKACFGAPASEVFEVIAAGDMVANKKPAPDVFNLALHTLGLAARDCVALEDSRNGLASAKAAGLRCIVSPSTYTDEDDFGIATAVVSSFEDISTLARTKALLGDTH